MRVHIYLTRIHFNDFKDSSISKWSFAYLIQNTIVHKTLSKKNLRFQVLEISQQRQKVHNVTIANEVRLRSFSNGFLNIKSCCLCRKLLAAVG